MSVGYDQPLYVLPFDHRGSFQTKMFGWKGALSPEQTAEIARTKNVIYEGFQAALVAGVSPSRAGVLVDEQFGEAVIRDAVAKGYTVAAPAEKSGQEEFDFEYGEQFAEHIEGLNPTFCKVLVRYNPEGSAETNQRQTERLKRLSDYLEGSQRRFMFELLVPPLPAQLEAVRGDKQAYEQQTRPRLMVEAVESLQEVGVEPDVWKIEGLDRPEDCERVARSARRGGRDGVGCIVLGRGEDEKKVREWLQAAAGVPGYIGFAVGRTTFWDPIQGWREGRLSRDDAIKQIADRYCGWVEIFERSS